jgi:hypothetical protein
MVSRGAGFLLESGWLQYESEGPLRDLVADLLEVAINNRKSTLEIL